jgi:hypothetical protein
MSQQHKLALTENYAPDAARIATFAAAAEQSLQAAEAMSAAPQKPFAEFLADYFA